MLDIVRRAFPGLSFSKAETLENCTLIKSDGETMKCLWSNAASLVDVAGQIDTAAALYALTMVCNESCLYLLGY